MLVFDALVRGRVMYEIADGPPERIPMGRCRVETHEGFVSLTWTDKEWTRSTTMSPARFAEWLGTGAVVVVNAAQLATHR